MSLPPIPDADRIDGLRTLLLRGLERADARPAPRCLLDEIRELLIPFVELDDEKDEGAPSPARPIASTRPARVARKAAER